MDGPLLVRVDEAARLLGVGRTKVYELIAEGSLPTVCLGKARRVPTDALKAWVAARVDPGSSAAQDDVEASLDAA